MTKIEGTYKHYKGNIYKVLCIAKHSETLEEMVVYQDASNSEKIWARPKDMWCETVEIDGEIIPRFLKID